MSCPARTGKGEKVLALPEPHQPGVGRPMRDALVRQHAAIGDRAVEHRARGRKHIRPQLGVNAVRGDDDVDPRRWRHWRTTRAPRRRPAQSRRSGVRYARRPRAALRPGIRRDRRGACRRSRSSPRRRSPAPARSACRRGGNNARRRRRASPIARTAGPSLTRSNWRTLFGVRNTPAPTSPSAGACS